MRTWGQVPVSAQYPAGWAEVTTDVNGCNDGVWLVTLLQCLQLNLGESPMFGNFGIPAQQAVETQVDPDYYVMVTQQQFAQYFGSLIISKLPPDGPGSDPSYRVTIVSHAGAVISQVAPT